jgi:hypothetical protein
MANVFNLDLGPMSLVPFDLLFSTVISFYDLQLENLLEISKIIIDQLLNFIPHILFTSPMISKICTSN